MSIRNLIIDQDLPTELPYKAMLNVYWRRMKFVLAIACVGFVFLVSVWMVTEGFFLEFVTTIAFLVAIILFLNSRNEVFDKSKGLRLIVILSVFVSIIAVFGSLNAELTAYRAYQNRYSADKEEGIGVRQQQERQLRPSESNQSTAIIHPDAKSENTIEYDTVTVVLPSRYRGANIEIDGMPAQILERTISTARIRIPIQTTNSIIEIKKEGEVLCTEVRLLRNDQVVTPCM